jgi:hypothetical protein
MVKRNRRKQTVPFDERLQRAAREARQAAQLLPQGAQRDMLLKKAGQAETAVRINGWLTSPGLRVSEVGAHESQGSMSDAGCRLPRQGRD